ncbi:WD repeat-containing protein 70 [Phoenix dactylifera]|uniref:WD repeat-containing protein 70 n=1 Tax=Phoenix dactylifera TaxID=42345 RepID=A0A8B7BRD3_PHODC|nr:WD repeat-containing protein 70 [Phoenix dactylifera]XP_008783746.2 WD repeat-containing protein 70 [Phoenix dactylifera]XP_008783747.2 WD repeat-containing protein 70 [Phoenix dactylifera]XP_026658717.2 WD repeat-containing protein 70 [Phoenix dactylifera]XP_026658718.2 WD repeat-containing protein 70 [Phoenix dactylifera]XP_026658719.2 WD repeat-containing protein 70 [Phoenix dactylifera]XP_038977362.1 WD repeat-containing protein 70 [Phoenix dactylifera]XP_038977363.1 WD repeat-contain
MDAGDMDEAIRAQFPLSFGKPSKAQPQPSAVHSFTRRTSAASVNPSPSFRPELGKRGTGDAAGGPHGGGEEEEDDVMIGPPPPPPAAAQAEPDADDGMMIGPPRPPRASEQVDSDDDGSDSGMDDSPEDLPQIPLSNEIVLKGHSKVVSALAVDHSGSRVLSGSYDYTVRMYDFQGMNSKLQSFRQLEPFEGHQVRSLSWSPTSDRFLCITGSAQAKIYDRDGLTLGEFIKGDMYIRDLKNTKGHISGLTGGEWNPKSKETILTSSEDGSLRIWDVADFKSQKQVIKPKLARPARIPVTACVWDREGKRIVGGIGDGTIQLWSIKPGWGSRPDIHVEKAHVDDITGLKFSTDGQILLSRSADSTLKVWDLRQMKSPVKVFEDLPNHYAQTNPAFSPDEQLILTGTSVEKEGSSGGLLCFFDRRKLELVSRVGISPKYSVICCAWHPKINQVFATVGDKKEGGTHILYDPSISKRGALVCVGRAPRKKSVDDFEAQPVIHNPHALPLFRDQPSRKRQREKALKDPMKSHKPELPVTGPGFGGRVGTTKGSLLTQYLMKQGGLIKETWMEEDPREAILKYADVAAKDPKYIAPAYADSQPEPVFAKSDSEEEEK